MTLTHMTNSSLGPLALRLLALALTGAMLTACATPRPAPSVPMPEAQVVEMAPLDQALVLVSEAEQSPDPIRSRQALDAVLVLDDPPRSLLLRAENLWLLLQQDGRTNLADRFRGAQLAMLANEPGIAFERLPPIDENGDPELFRGALALHAELLTLRGAWREALRERLRLDEMLLDEPQRHTENQKAIWDLMATIGPSRVQRTATAKAGLNATQAETLDGWISLFRALRQAGPDAEALAGTIREWEQAFPRHAGRVLLADLREASLGHTEPPRRIAVLLPLSGFAAELGDALLDGITAQFYRDHGASGSLLVFDTGGQPDLAVAHYRNAVQQGADRIIGPLTREAVERVAGLDSETTTILLNRPTMALEAPFTVLSLSPEDDARAAADRAVAANLNGALVLVPEGSFGERVAGTFRESFELQGGRVAAEHRFRAGESDINTQIGSTLGIEASQARINRLRRQLGLALEADAQIRNDIDVVFVAGPARDLRVVIPYLHYHRAGHLPMLSTAHAYEGRPQPTLDNDLSGVRFPDAPWLYPELNPAPQLRADLTAPEDGESAATRLPRFAALGIDAARVAADIPRYRQAPHLTLEGVAGTWMLQPLSRLWSREPAWLEFRNGTPRPLESDSIAPPDE